MSNIITVWQPLYYPRLHYFARLARSDIFVIFDDAEFSRSSPQHRAPIKHQNKNWLTIPISREDTTMPINEAKIDMGKDWINKHLGTFKAKYGGNSADKFNKFYEDIGDNAYLSDITIPIIKSLISSFEIDIDIHLSSETKVDYKKGSPSEYNADLSEHFGADTYYCGEYAYDSYLDDSEFSKRDIEIKIQDWQSPLPDGNVICLDPLFNRENPTEVID